MMLIRYKKILWVTLLLVAAVAICTFSTRKTAIDYNADIKPLLNKKCITCHGGVKRQSGFSLLFRADALAKNESGKPAIIPGDPEHSEMIRRLRLKDPEERMPYKHPPLSEEEISLLTRWIKEGAQWGDHWAYVAVKPVAVPANTTGLFGMGAKPDWIRNDIDEFIYSKLAEEKMKPSPDASKPVLLRRVSFDLTGMPVSKNISSQFLNSNTNDAYEKLVDSLLASPHFGERWASVWMDLARYADTKGYERDDSRSIWRYRDWLIKAFNADKPYDQFITEQIAGDLLPDPSDEQFIATAFNRNTMTNDEGGTDNEEFRTSAVVDRVNTTWEALMGTTFACVQCHSHPYDPFRHDEYYKFMAFFNNTRDEDTYSEYPLLREFHAEDSTKFISVQKWLKQYAPVREKEIIYFLRTGEPSINSIAADSFTNSALADTKWLVLRNNAVSRLKNVDATNTSQIIYRFSSDVDGGKWLIHLDRADGPILSAVSVKNTKGKWAVATTTIPETIGKHDLYFTYSNPTLKKPEDNGVRFDWFHFTNPFPGKDKPGYDSAFKHFNDLTVSKLLTITPIMIDNADKQFRATNVFERGNWLVKGKEVKPDVPRTLNAFPDKAPLNRLGLAQWIMDKKNPLTARTIVNRVWEQFFGQGIAETLEDMGTQGIAPTHIELLDYLSWKLMNDYNWSLKKLMKEMVMSSTYRQDSKFTKESLDKDPFNKWYARGPRVRLSAEQIRDQSLAASGLLSEKMFGPSVYPYQPEGIWASPYDGNKWKKSEGDDQHRRAVYTYWKRSSPYPSMITFDGTSRENCTPRRIRTNTPLQALTALNDSAYFEAAQFFACRMQEGGKDIKKQINFGYEIIFYTSIDSVKAVAFEKLYLTALENFRKNKNGTIEMAGINRAWQTPETAALITVAGAMMNTDEFLTKN